LVAIDKFTKWIEVKPVTCPKADRVLDFLDELVHLYGLPHRIIADLGSNFNNHQFWEYCENSVSYGPPWAHYLGGDQDRLLGGPLGLPGLRYTAPEGVEHKDYTEVVLG
jgi:hypothetical protein